MKQTVFIDGSWPDRKRMSWRNGYLSREMEPRPGWFEADSYMSHHVFDGKKLRVIVASRSAKVPYELARQIAIAYSMNLYIFHEYSLKYDNPAEKRRGKHGSKN